MAYSFASATTDYFTVASVPVSSPPFTMACWFNYSGAVTNRTLMSIESGTGQDGWRLLAYSASTLRFVTRSGNVISASVDTTATWSASTWFHACAVTSSMSNRTVYLNGGGAVNNTTSATAPVSVSNTTIGAVANGNQPWSGLIAEVGIWNVALTADEVASLGKGMAPSLIRPASLRVYVPLVRGINDLVGRLSFSTNGSPTISNHSRIYK